MIKKFLFPVCFLLLGTTSMLAEDGQYLHIHTADGWKVMDLAKVDRLTFSGNQMIASDANNATLESFDRSGLTAMYVDESAGVSSVISDTDNAAFSFRNGIANMLTDGRFEVYGIDGTLLVSIKAKKGDNIDLSDIEQSFVILKSGEFTTKVSLR